MRFISVVLSVLLASVALSAQWLKVTTPDTPRNADGTPNLSAATRRTADGKPDLSGVWLVDFPMLWARRPAFGAEIRRKLAAGQPLGPVRLESFMPLGHEVPVAPAMKRVYEERVANLGKDIPSARCLPHSIPDGMLFSDFKIIQTPRVTLVLFGEFNHFRQIFTDGRPMPRDPLPTWFGYSVAKWDGDTFVVSTEGFNDKSWMDSAGLGHSEKLRTTEKLRRRDFGHLDVQLTVEDPQWFTKPWSIDFPFVLQVDTELDENICENERDAAHLVGK